MYRVNRMAIAVATMALAASAIAGPVSAADKSALAVVNGSPGKKIDVCVNGKEIRSKLPYGKATAKVTGIGQKKVKVYRADPRRCKGQKLAQATVAIGVGSDKTIVVGKNSPRLRIFGNQNWGVIPRGPLPLFNKSAILLRHAADVGTANFFAKIWVPGNDNSYGPAAPHSWERGDSGGFVQDPEYYVRVRATMDVLSPQLGRAKTVLTEMGKRYEFFLVGSRVGNAKVVLIERSVGED